MTRSNRLLACLLPPMLCAGAASAADGDWYVGAGGGVSRLTPDTDGSGYTLDESSSGAFGVFGGREFGSRYAVELGATRLGEAGLSDGESIEYSVLSGGVLGYVLGDLERVRRGEATGGFLRLGLGAIDNASDVPLEKEDNVSVWLGVGADMPIGRAWGVRAELASFDGDAQAATVALVWRPRAPSDRPTLDRTPTPPVRASAPERAPVAPAAEAPAEVTPGRPSGSTSGRTPDPTPDPVSPRSAPVTAPEVVPEVPRTPDVPDAPGVPTRPPAPVPPTAAPGGDCLAPSGGEPVDERGCARFGGVLEGVGFAAGSAVLTETGVEALDRLAFDLLAEPGVTVEVRAHVAAGDDPAADKALSRDRAVATARHLAGRGVPIARLRARAFGGERPSATGAPDARIELGVVTP